MPNLKFNNIIICSSITPTTRSSQEYYNKFGTKVLDFFGNQLKVSKNKYNIKIVRNIRDILADRKSLEKKIHKVLKADVFEGRTDFKQESRIVNIHRSCTLNSPAHTLLNKIIQEKKDQIHEIKISQEDPSIQESIPLQMLLSHPKLQFINCNIKFQNPKAMICFQQSKNKERTHLTFIMNTHT